MSELTLAATHGELRLVRPWLDTHLPVDDDTLTGRIELCLHELAANVVDHAEADELSLRMIASPRSIEIKIHDRGIPVDLPASGDLDTHPRVRGYGMLIAEQLASELDYERRDNANIWTVRFSIT